MKYILRALRYFVFICLVMTLVLVVLAWLKIIDSDINTMFRNGYDSIWQIALMFLVVSFIYPRIGYIRKGVVIPGEYSGIRDGVVDYMEEKGYVLAREENENLVFHLRKPIARIFRKSDDTVTMTRDIAGFYVEGAAKDIVRIAAGLEHRFNGSEEA